MFSKMKLVNNTRNKSERNACFANTALQLLYSVSRMQTFFKMREYKLPSEDKRQMKICDEIARLFNSDGNYASSAAVLRHLIATKSGRLYFKDGTQQDIVEFLITLLQEVEEELSEGNREAKAVLQEFWGKERTEKKFLNKSNGLCMKCKSSPRDEEERFQVIQLDIPETSQVILLNGIVDNYFSENADIAQMKCNCCTHKTNCPQTGDCKPKPFASKRVLVKSPDVLILQINRFSNLDGSKTDTTVWPNNIITLSSGEEYKLCGIGHHLGSDFRSGHYISSVTNDGEWIRYNDTESSQKSESDSKSIECNVCIYTKVYSTSKMEISPKHLQTLPEKNSLNTKQMENESILREGNKIDISEDEEWLTPKKKEDFQNVD